jgi:Fic family protein
MSNTYNYTNTSPLFNGLTNYHKQLVQDRIKIEWTHTSNAIEGNTISLGDTAFIIEEGLTIAGKSLKEHNEVVGHAKAVDLLYGLLEKDKINKEDICSLHKAVQTNIVIDIECPIGDYKVVEDGTYLKVDDELKYFAYPHPNDIPHLMKLFFDEFGDISNTNLSLEEAIKTYTKSHLAFTAIHPFFDGNGRLGRLIANLPLLKNRYLPMIVDNKARAIYMKLLSAHKRNSQPLTKDTNILVEKNKYLNDLYEFFNGQYQNSQKILDEIKQRYLGS